MTRLLVAVLSAAVLSATSFAADYYVAMPADGGDDGNGGTSAAPLATIAQAITKADEAIAGGNIHATGGVVENCLIKGGQCDGDSSTTYLGAGIRVDGSAKVVNCIIIGNSASKYRGVYCGSSSASVVNCAIYDNGGTPAFEWGANNAARFVNCAVASSAADGFTGDGCIATLTDAAFTDYANGDYRPVKEGVLINAGTKWVDYLGYGATSEKDLAGAARLSGSRLDIGCYETATGGGMILVVR